MRALIEFEIQRAAGTQAACPGNPPVQPGTAGSTVVQTESREVWGILQRHFTPTTPNFNFQQVVTPRIVILGEYRKTSPTNKYELRILTRLTVASRERT